MQLTPVIGHNVYISPKRITVIPEHYREVGMTRRPPTRSMANLLIKRRSNALSKKARKNITDSINWLVYSSPWKKIYSKHTHSWSRWKVNFITLTLPAQYNHVTLREFNDELLRPWLQNMQRNYGMNLYVWKMEPTKVGTWHCHITTNTFLHKEDIRRTWNHRLRKCGYTKAYFAEHGTHEPPSTHVHSVRKVRDLAAYLANYMAKTCEDTGFNAGRLWGCSYELSRVRNCSLFVPTGYTSQVLRPACDLIEEQKVITTKPDSMGRTLELGYMLFPKARDWIRQEMGELKEEFDKAIFYLRTGYEAAPLIAYS